MLVVGEELNSSAEDTPVELESIEAAVGTEVGPGMQVVECIRRHSLVAAGIGAGHNLGWQPQRDLSQEALVEEYIHRHSLVGAGIEADHSLGWQSLQGLRQAGLVEMERGLQQEVGMQVEDEMAVGPRRLVVGMWEVVEGRQEHRRLAVVVVGTGGLRAEVSGHIEFEGEHTLEVAGALELVWLVVGWDCRVVGLEVVLELAHRERERREHTKSHQ
jgi:hypothetical protein